MNSQNDDFVDPEHILSANDLYNINSEVTGQMPFVRDHQLLQSAVRRPYLILFGEEQFPSLIDKAAATMIMAKHAFNPFSKLSHFNKGKNMLQQAIAADRQNVELRLLRYSIQKSAPSFLGYRDEMAADKNFLKTNLPALKDATLKQMIADALKLP